MFSSEVFVSTVWKLKTFSVLEQIVLVYRTLCECQVAACSIGSARTQNNRADRLCQCWRSARPGRRGQ